MVFIARVNVKVAPDWPLTVQITVPAVIVPTVVCCTDGNCVDVHRNVTVPGARQFTFRVLVPCGWFQLTRT